MIKPIRKTYIPLPIINYATVDLPAPPNLSYIWNWGSLLGLCLGIQIVRGLLLTIHYAPTVINSFGCVTYIIHDVEIGWYIRYIHANGASMFFICIYIHIARGIFFKSYKIRHVWATGVTIFLLTIATAFIGYLLPWGQIRFWGATVITNLLSAVPYIGKDLVEWLWGGYRVNNATLNRFFALHYLIPLVIAVLVIRHLIFLHERGSSNPIGIKSSGIRIPFHLFYTYKDIIGFVIILTSTILICHYFPNYMGDPENFSTANPLVTPTHIKPEWYFLWAYAILRSIPNKGGGVTAILAAIVLLYLGPLNTSNKATQVHKLLCISLFRLLILLTWVGGSPVETPYETVGLVVSICYFTTVISLILFV